jgi:hypothetical protein
MVVCRRRCHWFVVFFCIGLWWREVEGLFCSARINLPWSEFAAPTIHVTRFNFHLTCSRKATC